MSTVGTRLAELRQSLGWSQEQMAERLGIAPRTYQGYERDETEPKFQILRPLAELGGDPTWLVTGATSAEAMSVQARSRITAMVELPLYEAAFSAGKGRLPPDNEKKQLVSFPEEWVRKVTGRNPRNLIMASAEGDSMEPTITDGDELLIDITDQRLADGKVYALSVNGGLLVKRIQRSARGGLRLVSDNKNYDPEEISPDDPSEIQVIGQVIWWGHRAR